MFPKSKATSVPSDSQAKEKLANHVYEYLVHNGATKAAQSFLQEIHWDKPWQLGEAPGFLNQWWCVFYDLYNAAPERRESFEHSSEAKAFHDYGFINSGYPNGLPRNPSIPSPISGGMPPTGGRPPSSQGIIPPDNNIHTPVSIQGGPMIVPGGPFFAPGHPMSNIGGQAMDIMRSRAVLHPSLRFPQGPMMASYHPGGGMARHRFLGNSAPPLGIAHSPGPSGTPQTGPQIMPSPNDSLQNELQQNNSGQDPFGPNGSSRSPSHVISQPAPAFPPPPASESNSDQQNSTGMMNGGSQMPQFSQHQTHTMEYMPPSGMNFEPPVSMKHSPQLHNPNINEVIATMGNNIADFCSQIPQNGPPFTSDHAMRVSQSSVQMGGQPISQLHMMQQGLASHHMQSMPGGPSNPSQFISHPGGPINASPQFPDYAFTSMSQAI